MKRLLIVALFFFALCCAQREHQPSHYEKDGIRFEVPSTCSVESDHYLNEKHTGRAIQVKCPDHAVLSILTIPASSTESLEEFATHVASRRAAAIQKKFTVSQIDFGHESGGAFEKAEMTIHGVVTQGLRQHFAIELIGQHVPHSAEFYMLQTPQSKVIFMAQVADEHLDETRTRWKTIFDSIVVE